MKRKVARDDGKGKWIVGIDEAGRGPVLGPMVYAAAYCPLEFLPRLEEMEVRDSKVLTPAKREAHFQTVHATPELGFVTDSISPRTISHKMLEKTPISLNLIALESTIKLLEDLMKSDIQIDHVYVDTLGKAAVHEKRLEGLFPQLSFTVRAKADALFPIVSLASIVAKVTRDAGIENIQRQSVMNLGCGYPADPNTIRWLKTNLDPIFGFSSDIRFSWATCAK